MFASEMLIKIVYWIGRGRKEQRFFSMLMDYHRESNQTRTIKRNAKEIEFCSTVHEGMTIIRLFENLSNWHFKTNIQTKELMDLSAVKVA